MYCIQGRDARGRGLDRREVQVDRGVVSECHAEGSSLRVNECKCEREREKSKEEES